MVVATSMLSVPTQTAGSVATVNPVSKVMELLALMLMNAIPVTTTVT